ncbi:hypothetical protein EC9_47860 [Rosistilla ulvae]|uniref:Uncharacterized protein n=1 Tax=Rosistilla ulvae TaxID=1930277 RepID=A0A517M6R8_9BACT|nr:hypothetical protein EC9_47860 [Rosistilla ulvae]
MTQQQKLSGLNTTQECQFQSEPANLRDKI